MGLRHRPVLDSTPILLTEGYAWLPDRRRRTEAPLVRARLFGRETVALHGTEAVGFFYDERHVARHGAIPEPALGTLFGRGAVHTLDGQTHRVRKAMFMSLLHDPDGIGALVDHTTAAWDAAVASWAGRPRTVLFDESSRVIARGVCQWTGVPLDEDDVEPLAQDLVAMVDGFATLGPRHWRARQARGRRERWLQELIEKVRAGQAKVPEGSAVEAVAVHREADGTQLDARTAAVELLNILRPTVAVSWFLAFAAHALHRRPEHREALRKDDPAYAEAFANEVRRFYPFAPFVGGRAVTDLSWHGEHVPAGATVLLDLYGQNHDGELWEDPYVFRPQRFLDDPVSSDQLIPQGGGDPRTGHRCPGEAIVVELLKALVTRLAQLDYEVPEQDLTISLHRVPAKVADGFVLAVPRPESG